MKFSKQFVRKLASFILEQSGTSVINNHNVVTPHWFKYLEL